LSKAKASFREQQAYKSAALAQIKKNEKAEYYRQLEKESLKAAARKAERTVKRKEEGFAVKFQKGFKNLQQATKKAQGVNVGKGPNSPFTSFNANSASPFSSGGNPFGADRPAPEPEKKRKRIVINL